LLIPRRGLTATCERQKRPRCESSRHDWQCYKRKQRPVEYSRNPQSLTASPVESDWGISPRAARRSSVLSYSILDNMARPFCAQVMFTTATPLALSDLQKEELEAVVRNGNSSQKVALRGRILLLAHQGLANRFIARQVQVSRPTVLSLRAAFARDGMAAVTGIRKRNRRGRVLTPELEQKILITTLQTPPGDGSTHWSVRQLARQLAISRSIVHRVWRKHDVQPHRVERFKLSMDPHFEEKVRDIVGLYLNPPDRGLVLCVDER